MRIFSPIILILALGLAQNPDHWRNQTLIGLLLVAICIGAMVARQLDLVVGITFGTFLFISILHTCNPSLTYEYMGSQAARKIQAVESEALWFFLLATLPIFVAPKEWLPPLKFAFGLLCPINAIWMFVTWMIHERTYGILNNASLDGTLIAVLFPLWIMALKRGTTHSIIALLIPVLATFLSGSTTAVIVMSLVLGLQTGWLKWIASVATLAGLYRWGWEFFDSSMRFDIWKLSMEYWRENLGHALGAGPGTFIVFGPHVQITNSYRQGEYFLWMHNDWLQVTFEYGYIGLATILTLFVYLFAQSKHNRVLNTALIAFAFAALTQPMIRLFPTAILGALLVRLITEKQHTFTK